MQLRLILAAALIAAAGVSCGGNKTPSGVQANNQALNGERAASSNGSQLPDLPKIPKDARWTVFCATIAGPGHTAQARALRDQLSESTGMRDWYIVQSNNQSTLYYGFYSEIDDTASDRNARQEAQRAQNDRRRIAALMNPSTGARLFRSVLLVNLEEPDPAAPADWDLANAKGDWSLQVGVCKDSADRKQRAVEAVREARAQGYEAYYFHGPTASSVCIGAWPQSAVVKVEEARATNPNAVSVYVPQQIDLPEHLRTSDGLPVEQVQEKVRIADPELDAMMKKFPIMAFNGLEKRYFKDNRTGHVREVVLPSTLVKIPHGQRTAMTPVVPGRTGAMAPAPNTPAPPVNPWTTGTQTPQGGRLRSLEE